MDLDDLDGPSQAPARRTSRFQPKLSKPKPNPPKPELEPEPKELDSTSLNKKEEDSKPPIDSTANTAYEHLASSAASGVVKMEVESKAEDEESKEEPMEEDGDEDCVVREIDVFFNPPPIDNNTQLYVLQYPLRPRWRPYELDERCGEIRVKPESAEVEVDLSVDVDSNNYDTDASNRMTKQTLSSSWKPPRTTGYAVGVLMGNKLHLNPIYAVVQLRPSMEHLKSGGSKKNNNVTSDVEVTVKSEESNKEESVGPPKKQNKVVGNSNEQKAVVESWVPLKFHGSRSDSSARYLQKMVAQESSPIQFSMKPYDYMNSLCPGAFSVNTRPSGLSRRFLLSQPLEERFKTWLREGPPVHRFSALKHLAPDYSIEDVLGVLRQHSQLVQGLWVPKSSLLFPGGQGVEILARDYILLLFSKNPVISWSQLDALGSLKKVLKGILNLLAVERPSFKDWKFKEPTDVSFIKLHPDTVREQEQIWEGQEERIIDAIHGGGRSGPGTKNAIRPSMANRPGPSMRSDKVPTRAANGTATRIKTMSDETREALPKALQKLFQMHKVCSFQLICHGLRDMAVSKSTVPKADARAVVAAAYGVEAPQEELEAVISQIAINIHGVYVSKSSLENPELNPLRNVVINLFCGKQPNAKLRKADIVEAAKIKLERDINNSEYNKVLSELCISKGGAWVLKSGDGNPK